MLRSLQATYYVAKLSAEQLLAYPASVLFTVIFAPIEAYLQFLVWNTVLRGGVMGYTAQTLVGYFVLSWVVMSVTFSAINTLMQYHVVQGRLTQVLLRPVSYTAWLLGLKIGGRLAAIVLEVIPIIVVSGLFFGFDIFAVSPSYEALLSMVVAFTVTTQLALLLGYVSFYTKRSSSFHGLFMAVITLLGGLLAPLTFYPVFLQHILFFLPFQLQVYAPIAIAQHNYALAGYSSIDAVLIGVAWSLFLGVILRVTSKKALRRYTGAGQ